MSSRTKGDEVWTALVSASAGKSGRYTSKAKRGTMYRAPLCLARVAPAFSCARGHQRRPNLIAFCPAAHIDQGHLRPAREGATMRGLRNWPTSLAAGLLFRMLAFAARAQNEPSQIGREVAVPRHLQNAHSGEALR